MFIKSTVTLTLMLLLILKLIPLFKCDNGTQQKNKGNADLIVNCNDKTFLSSLFNYVNANSSVDVPQSCLTQTQQNRQLLINGSIVINYHNTLESIADLMVYWKRFSGTFIIDKFSGLNPIRAQRYLSGRLIKSKIIIVSKKNTISFSMKKDAKTNFIMICHSSILNQVISKAKSLGWFNENNTFVIVNRDIPPEISYSNISPYVQITLISPSLRNSQCLGRSQSAFTTNSLLKSCLTNHILCTGNKAMANVSVRVRSNENTCSQLLPITKFSIHDIFYNYAMNKTEWIQFAEWSSNACHRFNIFENVQPNDSARFKGKPIRMIIFQLASYVRVSHRNKTLHVEGYMKDIIDAIASVNNINFVAFESENVNSTFSGMLGYLHRREAEICLAPQGMSPSRHKIVRHTVTVARGFLQPAYLRLQPTVSSTTYFKPFVPVVWISIAFITFLTATELFLYIYFVPVRNWSNLSYRVIYGTFLYAFLIIGIFYNSNIIAYLTHQEETIPFRDIEDLISNQKYTVIITANGTYHDVLMHSKSGHNARLWQKLLFQGKDSFCATTDAAFQKMSTIPTVVQLIHGPAAPFYVKGNCSIAYTSFTFLYQPFYIIHRLDFPYTKIFNTNLIKMMEGGILQRLSKKHGQTSHYCRMEKRNQPLNIQNVQLPFAFYLSALLVTLITLLVENIYAVLRRIL